jgi:D-lactate dehydrogenase
MKIAFYETEEWEQNYLKKEFSDSSFPQKIGGDFDIISIFIKTIVDESFIDSFPNLKYIITRSAGFDHIDLDLCEKRNITVSYISCYGKNTVA